jgi:hypothetical protein
VKRTILPLLARRRGLAMNPAEQHDPHDPHDPLQSVESLALRCSTPPQESARWPSGLFF